MQFAGLERFSMIDFPGRLSAVAFTYGCNMRCPYCHNPELVTEPLDTSRVYDESDVIAFMQRRVNKLDGIVITGGEPTMHRGLREFIRKIKDLGFDIKLDTNGSLLPRVEEIMKDGNVDYWAMDVKYAGELYEQGLNGGHEVKNIQKTIDYIISKAKDYEFRTTVSRNLVTNDQMHEIGKMIKGAKRHFIQNFVAGKAIDPALGSEQSFTKDELEGFKEIMLEYVDEVNIRGI